MTLPIQFLNLGSKTNAHIDGNSYVEDNAHNDVEDNSQFDGNSNEGHHAHLNDDSHVDDNAHSDVEDNSQSEGHGDEGYHTGTNTKGKETEGNSISEEEHDGKTNSEDESDIVEDEPDTFSIDRHVLQDRQWISTWVQGGVDDEERCARRILVIMYTGVIPCPDDQHELYDARHLRKHSRHHSIQRTYEIPNGPNRSPSHFELQPETGIHRTDVRYPLELLQNNRSLFPSAPRLQQLFTGKKVNPRTNQLSEAPQICLHEDHTGFIGLDTTLKDIDSSITIFSRLDQISSNWTYSLLQMPTKQLTKNLHITCDILTDKAGRETVALHEIPHTYIGEVDSFPLYIFFPRMYQRKGGSTRMTKDIHKCLYDDIFQPAIVKNRGDLGPYTASSHANASLQAKARSNELRGGKDSRTSPCTTLIARRHITKIWESVEKFFRKTFHLSEERRQAIYSSMDEKHRCFLDAFFVYDTLNHKTGYRDSTLASALDTFMERQNDIITGVTAPGHSGFLKDSFIRRFVDIGVSVHASQADSRYRPEPITLLAKTCCQYNALQFLYGNVTEALGATPPGMAAESGLDAASLDDLPRWKPKHIKNSRTTQYEIHGLRDSVSITSEPEPSSSIYQCGVRYYQSYQQEHELYNAPGLVPFSHKGIPHLGLHVDDYNSMLAAAKMNDDRFNAEHAVVSSARRVKEEYDKYRNVGWRVELRVTSRLAELVKKAEKTFISDIAKHQKRQSPILNPCPKSLYFVPSSVMNEFVKGNVHKHLILLDAIRCYFSDIGTVVGTVTLASVVAVALRHFMSHIRHDQAWILNGKPASEELTRKGGFGLHEVLEDCGFAFWPVKAVNWDDFEIREDYLPRITAPELRIKKHRLFAEKFLEGKVYVDKVVRLMCDLADPRYFERLLAVRPNLDVSALGGKDCFCRRNGAYIMEGLVDHLIREYQTYVMREHLPEHFLPIAHGRETDVIIQKDIQFTLQSFGELVRKARGGLHTVRGNRTNLNDACMYFTYMWTNEVIPVKGHDSQFLRTSISKQSFHRHFEMISTLLKTLDSPYFTYESFKWLLFYRFFQQNSIFPYPHTKGSLKSGTKSNDRTGQVTIPRFIVFNWVGERTSNLPRPGFLSVFAKHCVKWEQGRKDEDQKQSSTPILPPIPHSKLFPFKSLQATLEGMLHQVPKE